MQDQRDLDQNEGHQVPGSWYLLYRSVIYGDIRYSVLLGSFIEQIYYYLYCMLYEVRCKHSLCLLVFVLPKVLNRFLNDYSVILFYIHNGDFFDPSGPSI